MHMVPPVVDLRLSRHCRIALLVVEQYQTCRVLFVCVCVVCFFNLSIFNVAMIDSKNGKHYGIAAEKSGSL